MVRTLVYQLYPLAWSGIREMTTFLPNIAALGADYVWLSPIYPSPRYDHGYDVADYYNIDYRLGTMGEFDEFVRTAHALGIKVIMDLVLNHTSIEHSWFHAHPEYYIWSKSDKPGWHNLFDNGPAWRMHPRRGEFYCHMFCSEQADLNWFPSGVLNRTLVEEFRIIIDYWMFAHDVDGFRLDAAQAINKKVNKETLSIDDLLVGEHAALVIESLAYNHHRKTPFLIMECFDPEYGPVEQYYEKKTDVEFFNNIMLKDSVTKGHLSDFRNKMKHHCESPRYILELESHDSPRFTTRSGLTGEKVLEEMFSSGAKAICLYQGQELGLENPSSDELPFSKLLDLDVRTAMQFEAGASMESLREVSRGNARVPLPLSEYARQLEDKTSTLSRAKELIREWKHL